MVGTLRRLSLKWKIGGIFALTAIVSGALIIVAAGPLIRAQARAQLEHRLRVAVSNLSDGAAGHLMSRNLLALHALVGKYSLLDGVAYAYIEDSRREVIAHTFATFPEELRSTAAGRAQTPRRLSYSGRKIYETSAPVLDGQAGTVFIGHWQDELDHEIRRVLAPLLTTVTIASLAAAAFAFLLAHWIVRPITGLLTVAGKVTMGDLETAVSGKCVESGDEIGELARSLERMRSSLKAAMLRLGRETT